MIFSPLQPVAQARKTPNSALGLMFNVFMAGAGFTYIDLPIWHLVWSVVMTFSMLAAFFLASTLNSPFFMLIPALLFVGMLVHYVVAYGRRFQRGQVPAGISDSLKWSLLGGQLALGLVFSLGVLPAVVMPNLLGARNRANDTSYNDTSYNDTSYNDTSYQVYVRMVENSAAAEMIGTQQPFNGPCSALKELVQMPVQMSGLAVESCTVRSTSLGDTQVTVVSKTGKTYTSR
jgi:hypothetical protein